MIRIYEFIRIYKINNHYRISKILLETRMDNSARLENDHGSNSSILGAGQQCRQRAKGKIGGSFEGKIFCEMKKERFQGENQDSSNLSNCSLNKPLIDKEQAADQPQNLQNQPNISLQTEKSLQNKVNQLEQELTEKLKRISQLEQQNNSLKQKLSEHKVQQKSIEEGQIFQHLQSDIKIPLCLMGRLSMNSQDSDSAREHIQTDDQGESIEIYEFFTKWAKLFSSQNIDKTNNQNLKEFKEFKGHQFCAFVFEELVKRKDRVIDKLRKENQVLGRDNDIAAENVIKLAEKIQIIKQMEAKIQDEEKKIKQLENQKQSAIQQISIDSEKIFQLQQDLLSIQGDLQALKKQNQKIKQQSETHNEELKEIIKKKEKDIEQYKSLYEKSLKKYAQTQSAELIAKKKEIEQLKKQLKELNEQLKEFKQLKEMLSKSRVDIQEANQKIRLIVQEKQIYEKQMKQKYEQQINVLKQNHKEALCEKQKQNQILNSKVEKLEKELKTSLQVIQNSKNASESAQRKIDELSEEAKKIKPLEQKVSVLSKQLQESKNNVSSFEKQVRESKQKITTFLEQLKESKSQIQTLTALLKQKEQNIKSLSENNVLLSQNIQRMEQNVKNMRESMKIMEQNSKSNDNKLKAANLSSEKLQIALKKLTQKYNALKEINKKLSKDLEMIEFDENSFSMNEVSCQTQDLDSLLQNQKVKQESTTNRPQKNDQKMNNVTEITNDSQQRQTRNRLTNPANPEQVEQSILNAKKVSNAPISSESSSHSTMKNQG